MEIKWTIPTPDGHTIYGVKNSSCEGTKVAIVMVHGLTSSMNDYAFKRAADFFANQYDVYRFNLYAGEAGGRMLVDCTIQTHADDLNAVLLYFGDAYEKIFLIGHSYGGTTIMLAQPERVTAASLWDPSFDLQAMQAAFAQQYVQREHFYIVNWGVSYLMGKSMYDEGLQLDLDACIKLAEEFGHPVQVVTAADGFYAKDKLSYHSFGHSLNRREIVAGTVHCFYEGDSCEELLEKTAKWFAEF